MVQSRDMYNTYNIINSGQESSRLYLYNTFHKFKINLLERCEN